MITQKELQDFFELNENSKELSKKVKAERKYLEKKFSDSADYEKGKFFIDIIERERQTIDYKQILKNLSQKYFIPQKEINEEIGLALETKRSKSFQVKQDKYYKED